MSKHQWVGHVAGLQGNGWNHQNNSLVTPRMDKTTREIKSEIDDVVPYLGPRMAKSGPAQMPVKGGVPACLGRNYNPDFSSVPTERQRQRQRQRETERDRERERRRRRKREREKERERERERKKREKEREKRERKRERERCVCVCVCVCVYYRSLFTSAFQVWKSDVLVKPIYTGDGRTSSVTTGPTWDQAAYKSCCGLLAETNSKHKGPH